MDKKLILWTILTFVLLIWTWTRIKHFFRSVHLALRLPGPPALPILGNVFTLKCDQDMVDIGTHASQKFGQLFRIWLFFLPFFFIYEPDHLKVILGNTKFSNKNFFYTVMHTFIGDGLITSNGKKWRKNRRLIQRHFQVNTLENYVDAFAQVSKDLVKFLSNQRYVQITRLVNTTVVTVLHKTVLGVDLKIGEESPFRRGELLVIKRLLKPWLLLDTIFKHSEMSKNECKQTDDLHKYIKQILDRRVEERKTKKMESTCLLDMFIELAENNPDFNEEDILNETVTFMLAGQDSVGAAVAFCLYFLAKHREVQDRVFKEINEIIYKDNVKTIKIEHLNQMHYLEQCIKETLRLAPSIPIVSRVLTCDIHLGKHIIPCGTNIFISPFITHRLPHIFPDPLRFDPDRFSSENLKKIHPFGFIPFSAGPRNCIGFKFAYLEMKTIIASIIKNYQISLRPGYEHMSLSYRVTLRVKGSIWLKILPREK